MLRVLVVGDNPNLGCSILRVDLPSHSLSPFPCRSFLPNLSPCLCPSLCRTVATSSPSPCNNSPPSARSVHTENISHFGLSSSAPPSPSVPRLSRTRYRCSSVGLAGGDQSRLSNWPQIRFNSPTRLLLALPHLKFGVPGLDAYPFWHPHGSYIIGAPSLKFGFPLQNFVF